MDAMSNIRVVLLGPPGSGKGTQARLLAETLGLVFIVASNVISETLPTLSPRKQKKYQALRDKGDLLPPGVVAKWLAERLHTVLLHEQGMILDGSPRSVKEAKDLAKLGIDWSTFRVFFLHISDEVSLDRMRYRRECARCRQPVPNFEQYKDETVCRKCGGALVTRKNATEKVLHSRVKTYHDETEPVVEYFRDIGVLTQIDGEQSIDTVTASILSELGVTS